LLQNERLKGAEPWALVTVKAQRNGVSASLPEVHVWRLKNGKATDFREYQGDKQREDRFWS